MITEEEYHKIKHLTAPELKKWLEDNNFSFSDVKKIASNIRSKKYQEESDGPFCSCCGLSQRDGNSHTNECMWH